MARLDRIAAAVLLLAAAAASARAAGSGPQALAETQDRTISFFHIHTEERLTVTYKKGGKFVPEAMKQINWIMRDWRKNQEITIDPNTVDIIWEMHEELGSKEPVHIICGYRSRDTNEMLRRTVGGQASQSQHITGKAIDITFPDVPLRRMRYSAMIRERGGVGYYPTSGVPFVHVDTARVRHWPRMPRDELALIFPSGHSQHEPADGSPLRPSDVERAKARNGELAKEVAAFFDQRSNAKPAVMVADAGEAAVPAPPEPPKQKVAVAAPQKKPADKPPVQVAAAAAPKAPANPGSKDRAGLDRLVTLAALEEAPAADAPNPLAEAGLGERTRWVSQPSFDEDHPEELTYRPIPLFSLMTETASFDDPALAIMVRPDASKTLAMLDDEGNAAPLDPVPGRQTASLMWAQQFRGEDVSVAGLEEQTRDTDGATQLASRTVTTMLPR